MGTAPTGSTTEFDEGIDFDKTKLNGGAPSGVDGGVASIDPQRLDRDPRNGCAPVYQWNFVRINTIFGVVHAARGYTAWSDKHPSYSSVCGPGDGRNVDDYFAPEINSIPVPLPGVHPSAQINCSPALPDQTAVSSSNAWTDGFQNIQCYDALKVNAIIDEIDGRTHNGSANAPVPTLFGDALSFHPATPRPLRQHHAQSVRVVLLRPLREVGQRFSFPRRAGVNIDRRDRA